MHNRNRAVKLETAKTDDLIRYQFYFGTFNEADGSIKKLSGNRNNFHFAQRTENYNYTTQLAVLTLFIKKP